MKQDPFLSITQLDREKLVTLLASAFAHRDFRTIERAMVDDVILDLPGSSPFAGEHRGPEAVGKFMLGLRQFLLSTEPDFTYVHNGASMTTSHGICVMGPDNTVDMDLKLAFTFDREGRISALHVEPSDPRLFTHVIAATFSLWPSPR